MSFVDTDHEALQARVEELEDALKQIADTGVLSYATERVLYMIWEIAYNALGMPDKPIPISGYFITPEMINAAVEYANDENKALPDGLQGCAWDALNKLNIFQCKHRPFGGVRCIEPGEHLNERCPGCAKWGSKGYTAGVNNDR